MAEPTSPLPATMRALVVRSTSTPPVIETVPTPQPTFGSAIVKVLNVNCVSYVRDIFDGTRPYPFPKPLIPGFSSIGRVVALGPDSTSLSPGDLVYIDCVVRSRDQPTDIFLAAIHHGHTPGAEKLMREAFRDWTFAEYARIPLENLVKLDEKRLTGEAANGGLGYSLEDLSYVSTLIVPFGGLRDIDLRPGETVVVAPASGQFGGAAVAVALAMGARVVAMGRNVAALERMKARVPAPERVEIVPITGDVEAEREQLERLGPIDAFFDIGPPQAYASSHIKSAISALRHGGRMSLMGGYREDVALPAFLIMHRNLRVYGKWMYERSDIAEMFGLLNLGLLKLGPAGGATLVGRFPLEEYKAAWDAAADNAGYGEMVVITP